MDLAAGPAVLGGVVLGVALGAWTLGRWQGGLAAPQDDSVQDGADRPDIAEATMRAPAPASTRVSVKRRDAARAHRQSAFDNPALLGEVHDEIAAFRRAEQVFAVIERDPLALHQMCRTLRVEGRHASALLPQLREDQPSARAAGFTSE
jgi:hypothetical protein